MPSHQSTDSHEPQWRNKQRPDYNGILLGIAKKDANARQPMPLRPTPPCPPPRRTPPTSPARNLVPMVASRAHAQQVRSATVLASPPRINPTAQTVPV